MNDIEHYPAPSLGRKRLIFVLKDGQTLGEFATKEEGRDFIRRNRDSLDAGEYTLVDTEERFAAEYRTDAQTHKGTET